MKINLTLALQLIHFVLAWKALKAFVLKPTLDTLKARQKKAHELLEALETKAQFIKNQYALKNNELYEFQGRSTREYPMPKETELSYDSSIPYTRDEDEIRKLTQKVTKLIIEEVPRVR